MFVDEHETRYLKYLSKHTYVVKWGLEIKFISVIRHTLE